jgi:hypothetical protein
LPGGHDCGDAPDRARDGGSARLTGRVWNGDWAWVFSAQRSLSEVRSQRFLGSPQKTGAVALEPLRGLVGNTERRNPRRRRSFSAISWFSDFSALKADVDPPPAERLPPASDPFSAAGAPAIFLWPYCKFQPRRYGPKRGANPGRFVP